MATSGEVGSWLGYSNQTIRQWADTMHDYLSAAATRTDGVTRNFTANDQVVLYTVHMLRQENRTFDEIHAMLGEGYRLDPPAVIEPEPPAAPTSAAQEEATGTALMVRMKGQVEQYKAEATTLREERDYLRDQLAQEREARVDAETRAAAAEARLQEREAHEQPTTPTEPPAPTSTPPEPPTAPADARPTWKRILSRLLD